MPARSLNQSEYAEVLERLAAVYLPSSLVDPLPASSSTEQTTSSSSHSPSPSPAASSPPPSQSDLQSLLHLLDFFSPSFVETLVQQAEDQRKEWDSSAPHSDYGEEFTTGRGKETAGSGVGVGKNYSKEVRSIELPGKKDLTPKERERIETERRRLDPTCE